ncbi:MAG TPA: YraN family protein [Rhizomicrobium sp.]|jgi:putative endonuclease
MTDPRRRKAEKHGRRSETFAAVLLMLKGYRILARRVKTKVGEIDLVARAPSGAICFIEVKARADDGAALDSVSPRQQARIASAATLYLAGRPQLGKRGVRYDIVTVAPGALPRHIRDAFRAG